MAQQEFRHVNAVFATAQTVSWEALIVEDAAFASRSSQSMLRPAVQTLVKHLVTMPPSNRVMLA